MQYAAQFGRRGGTNASAGGDEKRADAQELETWEDEGGRSGSVGAEARMLIVDNDTRAAESLELMLRSAGYADSCVAYSAYAALALAKDFRPDVVFLDLNLLDMDSNQLANALRERARPCYLQFVALVSRRQSDGQDRGGQRPFEHYLLKPINAADLTTLLSLLKQASEPRMTSFQQAIESSRRLSGALPLSMR